MKKMNNKGFMLTETLIVATFLVTTLLFIYIQFNNITRTYDTSFKYNTVNGMYNAKNIIQYINNDGIDNLKTALNEEGIHYINITNCSNSYFSESDYCTILMEATNVKTVLFTNENLTNLKNNVTELDQTLLDFINYINHENTEGYRIIIEFNDETFATLRV